MDPEVKLEQPLLLPLPEQDEAPALSNTKLNVVFAGLMAALYCFTFAYLNGEHEDVTLTLANQNTTVTLPDELLLIWAPPCFMWLLFMQQSVGFDLWGDAHAMFLPRFMAAVSATQAEHLLAMGLGHAYDVRVQIFTYNLMLALVSLIGALTFDQLFQLTEKEELLAKEKDFLFQAAGCAAMKCLTPFMLLYDASVAPRWTVHLFVLVLAWNFVLSGLPYGVFMRASFAHGERSLKMARFVAAVGEALCNFMFAMFVVQTCLSKE